MTGMWGNCQRRWFRNSTTPRTILQNGNQRFSLWGWVSLLTKITSTLHCSDELVPAESKTLVGNSTLRLRSVAGCALAISTCAPLRCL
jgi:hypothetical protein